MTVEQFANNPTTTLSAAITTTNGTSLTVASSSGFPSGGNFRILIDTELMKVTGISGTTWTVVRGDGGTTAATHSSAANVYQVLTKESLDALVSVQQAGTEVSARRVLNFIGASVADNGGNSRCDITVSGATYGPASSRPTAGQSGRLYIPNDPGIITSLDNGSTWVGFNPSGAPYTIPLTASNWTVLNSSFGSVADIPGGGITLTYNNPTAASDTPHGILRTISSATSYTLIACLNQFIVWYSFARSGMLLTDGTKIILFGPSVNPENVEINQYTASGTHSGEPIQVNYHRAAPELWLKITNDGTHRTYYTGIDGIHWSQCYQENTGTFLTEASGGVGHSANATNTIPTYQNLKSWSGA